MLPAVVTAVPVVGGMTRMSPAVLLTCAVPVLLPATRFSIRTVPVAEMVTEPVVATADLMSTPVAVSLAPSLSVKTISPASVVAVTALTATSSCGMPVCADNVT